MSGLFDRLRAVRQQTTPGAWAWSPAAKTGGRWPEPGGFVRYTIDDDGIHGQQPNDLDCIVAEHNAMGPILDAIERSASRLRAITTFLEEHPCRREGCVMCLAQTEAFRGLNELDQLDASLADTGAGSEP